MRIGHCQLDSQLDDFEGNLQKLTQGLERADRDHVELVSFPECFLTGYPNVAETARSGAFAMDSSQVMRLLGETSSFHAAFIVGFNELRDQNLHNTAVVVHKGHLLGHYSKCSAYMKFYKQGREFPVFEHNGLTFGVVICSDGGYIEPARILAMQGAQVIFAPRFNYIGKEGLISHFMKVRADHVARAVENSVYFVRGNNVSLGPEECIVNSEGVGYGDSYILDPYGEIVVRSRRHQEDFIFADIEPQQDTAWGMGRSLWSVQEFGEILLRVARK